MRPGVELMIDSLAAGGDGVARDAAGRVVFVPYSAPGDRLRVEVVEDRGRYARGVVDEILEAGPGRATPRCPVFERCGGCSWQHLSYPLQCSAKRAIVRDALERIGKLQAPPLRWYASPDAYGYRARARVVVDGGRVGFRGENSREVVPIDACPVLLPALNKALQGLATTAARGGLDGEWELAADASGNAAATPLRGAGLQRVLRIGDENLTVRTGVFAQAHPGLVGPWAHYVALAAGRDRRVLELFAGAGTLSLALARRARHLVAVESDRRACQHLRENLAGAGLEARVIRAGVNDHLLARWLGRHRPEVVVLDPPRAGLGQKASTVLGGSPVEKVIYAACDPAPWARDLRVLSEAGFTLASVAAFDFFPQSAHVEAVAVLDRP